MVKMINTVSDYLVNADKVNYGIGLLWSDYASFICDAEQNENENLHTLMHNSNCKHFYRIYTELRKAGYSVNIVRAEHLKDNVLGIKNLYIPICEKLSSKEINMIDEFISCGGKVYEASESAEEGVPCYGYKHYKEEFPYACYKPLLEIEDTFDNLEKPLVKANKRVMLQLLKGKDYYIVCLTNNTAKELIEDIEITTEFDVKEAVFYSNSETLNLTVEENKIKLPHIKDGGLIILN